MSKTSSNPLEELIKQERDARRFGFDWTNQEMIVEQAISECQEILEEIHHGDSKARLQEEIGDLLHTAVSLCLFAGFDVDETIEVVNRKFAKRMNALKALAKEEGLADLRGQSMDFMLSLWKAVKAQEQS